MDWLIFIYKVPTNPSAKRVYVWRKLKKYGAYSLQDSIFVLPKTLKNKELLQWLSQEIMEMDGEAFLFDGSSITENMEKSIIENMTKAVEEQYDALLAKVQENESDPEKLNILFKEFSEVKNRDYFQSDKGRQVYGVFVELQKKLNGECQS